MNVIGLPFLKYLKSRIGRVEKPNSSTSGDAPLKARRLETGSQQTPSPPHGRLINSY